MNEGWLSMSIRPVEFNGMIQNTHDASTVKHNQEHRPVLEQQILQSEHVKQEHNMAHKVSRAEEKTNDARRYDAKDKGDNQYDGDGGKKRQKEKKDVKEDKVMLKTEHHSFDVKI